jgi:hypothetical protein
MKPGGLPIFRPEGPLSEQGPINGQKPDDLACGRSALWLWCLPVVALFVGFGLGPLRLPVWLVAFAVMGGACVVNAMRCGRLHCYLTGPLFLMAALYCALALLRIVPEPDGTFLLIVLGVALLARMAEVPLGSYRRMGPHA